MKEGFVRITGMPDVFYDSIEKLYRYRMHCPAESTLVVNASRA